MPSPPSSHITNPWKTPEQTASSSHGHDEVISPETNTYSPDFSNYTRNSSSYRHVDKKSASPPTTTFDNQTFQESNHDDTNNQQYVEADAGDGMKAHEQYLTGFPLFLTISSCIISLFLVALDQTIVSTILTTVGNKFNAFEKIGWLTSGFMLPMACLVPSYGNISIAFGRKWTLVAGIIIFEIGSLISAISNSMSLLIGGRVIQGIGGGSIQAIVMVILTEVVPMNRRSLVFALISVVYSTSSVLGPIIGGALEKITWRWCFYINLPLGGAALVILMLGFHPPKPQGNVREKLLKIDFIGFVLLTSGLVLVLLALTFGGVNYPWNSGSIIALFTVGGGMLLLFVIWNFKYSANPIILTELIVDWRVLLACLSGMFNFAFFISNLTYLAVYFQVIFNASSLQSGIDLLPMVISVTLASLANSFFIDFTKNVKITMLVSGVLSPLGCGLFLLLNENSSIGIRIGLLIISGVSIGLQFQSSLLSAQLAVSKDIPGATILVTVFLDFVKNFASTISVTLAQLLYQTTGQKYITDMMGNLPEDSQDYKDLNKYTAAKFISNPEIVQDLPDLAKKFGIESTYEGIEKRVLFGSWVGYSMFYHIAFHHK